MGFAGSPRSHWTPTLILVGRTASFAGSRTRTKTTTVSSASTAAQPQPTALSRRGDIDGLWGGLQEGMDWGGVTGEGWSLGGLRGGVVSRRRVCREGLWAGAAFGRRVRGEGGSLGGGFGGRDGLWEAGLWGGMGFGRRMCVRVTHWEDLWEGGRGIFGKVWEEGGTLPEEPQATCLCPEPPAPPGIPFSL